ncbi:MAG: hypothetical protein LDL33_15860 [Desulfomonile sp.]|nr:hypothetical protein [Desulfomonile sp.]
MRLGIILAFAGVFPIITDAFGQAPDRQPKPPPKARLAGPEAPFSPTIGGTGFSVPIPEIKMESIVGERRAPKPSPTPPEEAEQVPPKPMLAPERVEQPPSRAVQPAPEPSPPTPAAAEPERTEAVAEPAPSEAAPVEHLPFEPPERGSTALERAPETRERVLERSPATPAPPVLAEPSEDEDSSRFVGVPSTPDEVLEAPVPAREILKAKPAPKLPELLEGQAVKTAVSAAPLKATAVEDIPSEEWIHLDSRREKGSLTPPATPVETHPVPPVEAPSRPDTPQPAEPRLGQASEPVPLAPPAEETEEPDEELPPVEPEPERQLPEVIPSPLDDSALDSGAVREYLTASVPVLEELSLLMTRVPSLDVADFDPSETDPAAGSTDLLMKLDSLKRELQVLDSKTFSIIPPSQYVLFHSLIRESITQTYQACEAMIAFMQNRKEDDLTRVREHISKARDLLGRTRKSRG